MQIFCSPDSLKGCHRPFGNNIFRIYFPSENWIVIPTKVGIYFDLGFWIPVFTGMTLNVLLGLSFRSRLVGREIFPQILVEEK